MCGTLRTDWVDLTLFILLLSWCETLFALKLAHRLGLLCQPLHCGWQESQASAVCAL